MKSVWHIFNNKYAKCVLWNIKFEIIFVIEFNQALNRFHNAEPIFMKFGVEIVEDLRYNIGNKRYLVDKAVQVS